jgi:hypothetical protein
MQDQLRHLHETLSEEVAKRKERGLTFRARPHMYGLDIRLALICIRFKGFYAITS